MSFTLPVSARIPEPDEQTIAQEGLRQLAGIFADIMLTENGTSDAVPVDLVYENGEHDTVFLVSFNGHTSLAGVLFGPPEASSEQMLSWAAGLRDVIDQAIDAYDTPAEAAPEPEAGD